MPRRRTGYNSCERCVQHGQYHDNTVVLLDTTCQRRTDEAFHSRSDLAHHKTCKQNILGTHRFPMVSGFILDSMHMCYIGATKRILGRLLCTKVKHNNVRINSQSKKFFDSKLTEFQNYIPCDFSRKLEGGLGTILKWKATQYRIFVLYVGIVLFKYKEVVSTEFYENFLKFAIAMRLLSTEKQNNNIPFIKKLLHEFVEDASKIYSPSFVCYNIHNLIHLPDDYLNYGALDKISAFSFESYLGAHIKGAVRAGFKPLIQIGDHVAHINRDISKPPQLTSSCSIQIKECRHEIPGIC